MAMPNDQRQILRRNRVDLVKDIMLGELLFAVLQRDNIVTEDMREEIEAEKTRQSKVGVLLDMLPRRGRQAFPVFIEALITSNQDHLAKMLDSTLCAELKRKLTEGGNQMEVGDSSQHSDETDSTIETKIKEIDAEPAVMSIGISTCNSYITNQEMYPMSRKPRGRAVIISNFYFTTPGLKPRLGTAEDVQNLTALFQQLHFTVICHNDLTAEAIHNTLRDESRHSGHSHADAFVLMVLSHGSKDAIYSLDGKEVHIDEITSYFYSDKCPGLTGKPKLFIIQACQGSSETSTVQQVGVAGVGRDERDGFDESDGTRWTGPVEGAIARADILVAKATVNGFVARRNIDKGSWFIRCLVYVLSRKAYKDHIGDMLTEVIRISATRRDSYIQLPVKSSDTLTHKLYFMP